MVDVPDLAADKFKLDIQTLKNMAEESRKLHKMFSDEFPVFKSVLEAEEYIINVHAKHTNNASVLTRLIEKVKTITERTLKFQNALSPEDFRSYSRKISQIEYNYELDNTIDVAENSILALDAEVTRLKNHASLYIRRNTVNRDHDVRPPRVDIPTFSGKTEEWLKFWNPYNFAVHSKEEYSKEVKLTILVGKLKGEAAYITDSLDISAESYDFAIAKLQEEYGDPAIHLNDLSKALRKIPSPNYDESEISESLLKMEMVLKRLNFHVNDTNSVAFVTLLENKFPKKFRDTITDIKTFAGIKTFTFNTWLESAKRALMGLKEKNEDNEWPTHSMQTNVDYRQDPQARSRTPTRGWQDNSKVAQRKQWKNTPTRHRSRSPNPRPRVFGRERSQSPAPNARAQSPARQFTRSPSRSPSRSRPKKAFHYIGNCPYCSRKHTPEECPIDPEMKITLLKEDQKCWACFKTGHSARDCEFGCAKCGSGHHVSTCKVITTKNYLAESVQASTGLMVGAANVANSDETLTFILDTGSDHSYILKETVGKLELPIVGSQTLMISTFGGNKSTPKQHDVARLTLKDADGIEYDIDAFVVEHIAERIGTATLNQGDKNFLASRNLTLVNGNHKFANPDLLIGIDYFFDIIDEDMKHIRLPSGLHYFATRHGGLITGSAKKLTQTLATFQGTSVTHCYSTIGNGGSADGGSEEESHAKNSRTQDFRMRTALHPRI